MQAARFALALLALGSVRAETASHSTAPSYSIASIVNSASNTPGALAPNSIATIYGNDLSYNTRGIGPSDLSAGSLPEVLGGVQVYVGGILANLYYVSPHQINFLIPNLLLPGPAKIYVAREGTAGPAATVTLLEVSPSLFEMNKDTVIATHADGKVVTPDSPATGGEIVVLYAVGLGRTSPDSVTGQINSIAAPILHKDLHILLNGDPIDQDHILYAGAWPGFAGLYQINVRLPDQIAPDPEIRITEGDQSSKASLKIPAR